MTYNIWVLNGKRPAVADVVKVIRSEGVPDLILLQEVRGGHYLTGSPRSWSVNELLSWMGSGNPWGVIIGGGRISTRSFFQRPSAR